jgi:hypothetical protein
MTKRKVRRKIPHSTTVLYGVLLMRLLREVQCKGTKNRILETIPGWEDDIGVFWESCQAVPTVVAWIDRAVTVAWNEARKSQDPFSTVCNELRMSARDCLKDDRVVHELWQKHLATREQWQESETTPAPV